MLSVCIISCLKEVRGGDKARSFHPALPSPHTGLAPYICDDGHPEVRHVGDDLTVLRWDLGVLDQLVQVFLSDA